MITPPRLATSLLAILRRAAFGGVLAWSLLASSAARGQVVIYASTNNDQVQRFTPPGPATNFASLPFDTNPEGLAFDSFGNLFVAGGNNVTRITPGGAVSLFATLPVGAGGYGLVIDAGNNLYVAGVSANLISRITPGGVVSTFATLNNPTGLAFDPIGNLYAAGGGLNIRRITPDGVVSNYATLPQGFNNTYGLAFDAAGFLYVADLTASSLFRIAPGGGAITTFGTLSSGADGLSIDGAGNIYAAQLSPTWFPESRRMEPRASLRPA